MVLGAMYCLSEKRKQIYSDIREIKEKHGLNSRFEIKWTKVSESKIEFYLELLDYFWENSDLHYRGLVATGKDKLNHTKYNNDDYDLWYYKMYFRTLDPIIRQENEYHILVDIKDTKGGKRIQKLKEVMCNNIYDFNGEVITHIGQINSAESEILQLADLLNGALAYHYRNLEIESMEIYVPLKWIENKAEIFWHSASIEQKAKLDIKPCINDLSSAFCPENCILGTDLIIMNNGDIRTKCLYRALRVGWIREIIELYNENDVRVRYWEKVNSNKKKRLYLRYQEEELDYLIVFEKKSEKRVQLITAYPVFFVSAKKDYEKDYQNYIKEIEKETK